ncbi:hypothetical protein MN608_11639 [Microdochium nivale]|nr:hypothetical protein MN608_11639 [Microdochium nivale]
MTTQSWEREDVAKPSFPYLPGLNLQLRRHIPPPPFGGPKYSQGSLMRAPSQWLKSVSHIEAVLAYPPLDTVTEQEVAKQLASIQITKAMAVGNARGAQIVECTIHQNDTLPTVAIAKIFDGLFYARADSISGNPVDTMSAAERDYSREANAYEYLQSKNLTGAFAPSYFGSWTFSLPVPAEDERAETSRNVRMILIEHLDGSSLLDLFAQNRSKKWFGVDASHLPETYRLQVTARVLEGIVRQRHVGVEQGDTAPRNIVVVPSPHRLSLATERDSIRPRVVLIDYNAAVVLEHTLRGRLGEPAHDLPRNPADFWWEESLPELAGWVPDWWYQDDNRRKQWLVSQFVDGRSGDFAPPRRTRRSPPLK